MKAFSTSKNEGGQLLVMASSEEILSNSNGIIPTSGLVQVPSTCMEGKEHESVTLDKDIEREERRKIAQKVLGKQG